MQYTAYNLVAIPCGILRTNKVEFSIVTTPEFTNWLGQQSEIIKGLVRARFSRIEVFAYLESKKIIILQGGTKNGQKKDIKKAKSLIH